VWHSCNAASARLIIQITVFSKLLFVIKQIAQASAG